MSDVAQIAEARVVPGRECGTCTLCCKLIAVAALGKPPGVWCTHTINRVPHFLLPLDA